MNIKKAACIITPFSLRILPLRSRLKNLSRTFESAKRKLKLMNDDVKHLLGEVYAG